MMQADGAPPSFDRDANVPTETRAFPTCVTYQISSL